MIIFRVISKAWHDTPDDAARIVAVALLMPVLFMLYQLGTSQMMARLIFTLSLGALGVLISLLVQEKRDLIGFMGVALALFTAGAAITSLAMLDDPTWTWRVIMTASQGVIVAGWLLLWRVADKWLSRAVALSAFLVSLGGLAVYILSNFGLPDPAMQAPWSWGWSEPKGITRRTLDLPLDMLLTIALVAAVLWHWMRYLLRHGGASR